MGTRCLSDHQSLCFLGALEDCKAAFSGCRKPSFATVPRCAPATLEGDEVPAERFVPLRGYHHSQPVRVGSNARDQLQLSMYGDMLATAELFIRAGHVLDLATSRMLGALANHCADRWRLKDSGIWELPEQQHYTHSKMACWLALDRARAGRSAPH